ncbi:MAG: NupC/NupG family nucleoside CNT transporter [Deltaproteobacteria bacterium]|nr:NupC/NupG family nucleoside CNT transporter [Deltaproteobacteria bacterium]
MWWLSAAALAASEPVNFLPPDPSPVWRIISFLGVFGFVGVCWVASENRRAIRWRPVLWGVGLQMLFTAFIVLTPGVSDFFYTVVDEGVRKLLSFSETGASFLFGTMAGHALEVGEPEDLFAAGGHREVFIGQVSPPLKTFAFWILPSIIFFSSLMGVLYHLGVMQIVVRGLGWSMMRTMGTSGAESLSTAGNIFLGQTEAPLLIKPFIGTMTRSELMCVMVGGFATVAGGVMGAYVKFLEGFPDIAGHLVVASIITAPATIAVSKLFIPETEVPVTLGRMDVSFEKTSSNVIEAAGRGASEGMSLLLNVGAMLIAFVALVAMIDWFVGFVPVTFCADGSLAGGYECAVGVAGEPLNMSRILGWVFAPFALLMGIPPSEALVVGRLLGEKLVLTEFVAYIHLGEIIRAPAAILSERTSIIASYALCGFANFASVGIQLGGIGGMAPHRMADLASIGLKAMFAGMIATCMAGAVVGTLL